MQRISNNNTPKATTDLELVIEELPKNKIELKKRNENLYHELFKNEFKNKYLVYKNGTKIGNRELQAMWRYYLKHDKKLPLTHESLKFYKKNFKEAECTSNVVWEKMRLKEISGMEKSTKKKKAKTTQINFFCDTQCWKNVAFKNEDKAREACEQFLNDIVNWYRSSDSGNEWDG